MLKKEVELLRGIYLAEAASFFCNIAKIAQLIFGKSPNIAI